MDRNLFEKKNVQRFLSKYAHWIWATIVSSILTLIFTLSIFIDTPLFGIPFLGPALVASVTFLLVYFFGASFIKYVGSWLESLFSAFMSKVLSDFWRAQSGRLAESIRRENQLETEKPKQPKTEEDEFTLKAKGIVLDTSAIIDGRILGVIKTGYIDSMILVTQNVIDELKFMADKKDTLKREKGRRGLDLLKDIKKASGRKKFKIIDLKTKPEDVDDSLVVFCKKNNCKIATVDYNLNKAAQVAGVSVLNINKLANEVRLQILPGEIMMIKLVQKGKAEGQAVGYLEDGTMIVVKDSDKFIDEHKEIVVDKVLQTSAGRMIFASLYVELEVKAAK